LRVVEGHVKGTRLLYPLPCRSTVEHRSFIL